MLEVDRLVGAHDTPVKVLMQHFEGRVYTLMLVFLALPFCQPIVLPGLSTPFGIVITLLGFRYAFAFHPWLPERFLNTHIPAKLLHTILQTGSRVLVLLEKLLHPRLTWIPDFKLTQCLSGCAIGICGICLLLPLPIPLSNLLPAIAIVVIAAALAERDGLMLIVGGVLFLFTLAFFAAIAIGGKEIVSYIWDWIVAFLLKPVPPIIDPTPPLIP